MIGTLILRLVHYLVSLAVFVKQWIFWIPSFSFKKNDISSARSDARNIQKLPLHLGFAFLEEELSYNDIANAILWTAAMGISYISIYDLGGSLKRNEATLYDALEKNRSDMDTEQSQTDIVLNCGIYKKDKYRTSSSVDVFILSLEDGRQCIASTARSICSRVATKQFSTKDITLQTIDTLIQAHSATLDCGFIATSVDPDQMEGTHLLRVCNVNHFVTEETGYPDLDLIIKFGHVDSLLGFMPWHVRLTEILSIPSHVALDYKTFKSVLVAYGGTSQRFGK